MKLIFVVSILMIFLARGAESSMKAEIILDAQIEVSAKEEYLWSDLVRMRKSNHLVLRKLSEIKIPSSFFVGTATEDGFSIPQEKILKAIRGLSLKDVGLWKIPEAVHLRRVNQASAAEIERKLGNQFRTQCDDCDFEIFVEKIPAVKGRQWKINVSDLSIKNSVLVPLEVDGKSLWISVRVKAYKNVPVTTRLIPALQKIQPGDLEMKRLDMAQVKDGFLTIEQMIGMTMNRSLSVGAVVGASDVKREAAIKKGQLVKVLIENADFEIQSNATAEEAGYIGDLIKVKSSDNQKLIMGKIKDNNSVVIQ